MARTRSSLVFLTIFSFVQCQSPHWVSPPTCYSKVLEMGREISARVADIKDDPQTGHCADHMPYLSIDVHNACVMDTMQSFMSMIELMRHRRCAYTRKVQELRMKLRQLHMIIAQRCHGDLVFTIDDCTALGRRSRTF